MMMQPTISAVIDEWFLSLRHPSSSKRAAFPGESALVLVRLLSRRLVLKKKPQPKGCGGSDYTNGVQAPK
jgi:hypothetical protein